jgi:hypothetical protein
MPRPPADGRCRARRTALTAYLVLAVVASASADGPPPDVELFTRHGCPHCAAAHEFLGALARERPGLRIVVHDVAADPEALARLRALAAAHQARAAGVPTFLVGGELVVGFDGAATTGVRLRALLGDARRTEGETVDTRLFGRLDARDLGLPLFTVALGLVDGLNPCAMWVLLFVLSLLVNLHDRRRMVAIGGTFVAVSGLAYLAFMAAWLNVFLLVGASRVVELALGAVAAVVGGLNVKDFFAFGRGPSIGIPEAAKPGIYARARRIVQAENLPAALAGAFVLAVLVNVVELLCTAGLPAVYTRILTLHALPAWGYYGYLLLYVAAYMADDASVLAVAVVTLGRRKLHERGGRWLKLVSGAVMLALGFALVTRHG